MQSIHCKDEDRCANARSASRNVPFRKVTSLETAHREVGCLDLAKQSQGAMKFSSASFCVRSCHHWPSVVHLPVTEAQDHRNFHKRTVLGDGETTQQLRKLCCSFRESELGSQHLDQTAHNHL